MRSYTVHRKRRTIGKPLAEVEATVFVRDGFRWFALLVPPLWSLYHRLWLVLLAYLVIVIGLNVAIVAAGFPETVNVIVSAGIQFLFAAEAGDLIRWTLARRGHDIVAVIMARSEDEAETRYFRGWAAAVDAHQKVRNAREEVQIAFRSKVGEELVGPAPDGRPA